MINKKLIILTIFLVSLLAVSAVSAADNATSDIDNNVIQSSDDQIDEVIAADEKSNQEVQIVNDENNTLTASFSELQSKIDNASEGDEIFLDRDYSLAEGEEQISITKNITINGNGHTLNGNDAKRILSIDADGKSITLKNIKFENGKLTNTDTKGGAIFSYSSSTSLTIINCEFKNNRAAYGGAIDAAGTLTIINSTFENNNASTPGWHESSGGGGAIRSRGTLIINGQNRFTNNSGEKFGGAIYATQDVYINWDDKITDSSNGYPKTIFENNTSPSGGAIHCINLYIKNPSFIKNYADLYGGAIYCVNSYINNTIFVGNHVEYDGGAIYSEGETYIYNSTFEENKATISTPIRCFGGAIRSDKLITVDSCIFNNNHADNRGGAIYAENIKITNSNFTNNYAKNYGGAVFASTITSTVYNSTFTKNKVTGDDGGAIYINNKCTFEISKSLFEENTAKDRGGAIYLDSSSANIKLSDCSFTDNHADSKGGAIYNCGEIIIKDSNFTNNTAKYAGAVYTGKITQTVSHSTFTKNQATSDDGGAVYINNKCTFEISECIFKENTAKDRGGAIYLDSSSANIKLSDCSFTDNHADSKGGAIYNCGEIIIKDSNFTNNTAKYAGAVYTGKITQTVSHSTFTKNQATTDDGGAIYIEHECNSEFISCRFEENTAQDRGGVICTNNVGVNLKISYSTFIGNKAGGKGQIAYSRGPCKLVDMCWFGTNNPDFKNQIKEYGLIGDDDYIVSNYLKIGMKVNESKIVSGKTYKATVYFYAANGNNLTNDILHSTGAFYGDGRFFNVQADCNDMTADVVFTKEKSTIYGKLNNQIVSLTLDVEMKNESSVVITSCENVTYPNAVNVAFEISNRTTVTYVIKNNKGEIIKQGDITDANTLSVNDLLQGQYTITITNAENETTHPSSASATFHVTRMASVNVTADNVTYGNPTTITITSDCDGIYTINAEDWIIPINVVNGIGTEQVYFDPGDYQTTTKSNDEFVILSEVNETSFSVYRGNIYLELNINNEFIYPDNITGTITTNILGKYKLRINETEYVIDITSKSYEFSIGGFDAGKYRVSVESMIEDYNKATDEANITITKGTPEIQLFIPNYNTTEEIEVFAYSSADGTYTVKVGSINKTMTIKNNYGAVNLETKLSKGTHTATIEFEGNKNYNPSSNSTNFTVSEATSMFGIAADNPVSVYGTPITITHTIAPDATGHITYYIFDEKYAYLPVSENLTIPKLDAGTYLIEAVYSGDGKYNSTGDVILIQSNKATNTANVTVENVTYGTLSNITIKADADGNYTVDMNGIKVTVNVKEGTGSELVKLNAGSYSTYTTFDSNNYNTTIAEADFEVKKAINNATVTVENTTYGKYSIINIAANVDGIYTVNISGRIVTVNVKNGKGNNQTKLDKGTYTTNTTFADDNYELNVTEAKFEVNNLNNVKVTVENTTYGNPSTIQITADADGIYTVKINETLTYNVTVIGGIGSQSMKLEEIGIYSTNTTFTDDRYQTTITEANFEVYKADNNITIFAYGGTYDAQYIIFIMADFDGNYTVKVDGTTIPVNISSGVGLCDAGTLEIGQHNVTVNFTGNNNIKSSNANASFTIYKGEPILLVEADSVTYGEKAFIAVYSTLDGNYTLTIDKKTINITVEKGFYLLETGILNAGEYTITVTYPGDSHHENTTDSTILKVNKMQTKITASTVKAVYNAAKNLVIKLTDAKGKPLANVKVTVNINGAKTYKTDKNGQIKITTKGLAPKTYTAKITFNGNTNYAKSTKNVKITITKAKSKITAKKNTKYKAKKKIKKYKITLKSGKNPIKKVKVTITIKGKKYKKTFKAKTNKKGKATFKIKKLTKKGKYKVTIKFKGNKYYKPTTKKTKIRIK